MTFQQLVNAFSETDNAISGNHPNLLETIQRTMGTIEEQVQNKQADLVSDENKTLQFRITSYLLGLNFSDEVVAGFLGNWFVETTDFNPMKVQQPNKKKPPFTKEECLKYTQEADNGEPSSLFKKDFVHDDIGYGLAQWTYHTRKQKLKDTAKKLNGSVGDLEVQLSFVKWELFNPSKGADGTDSDTTHMIGKKLEKCTTIKDAATLIARKYECQKDQSEAAINKRISESEKYQSYIKLVRVSIE